MLRPLGTGGRQWPPMLSLFLFPSVLLFLLTSTFFPTALGTYLIDKGDTVSSVVIC